MKRLIVAPAFACASVGEASAWNARGHMMVATVAWDRMSDQLALKPNGSVR